ncbi:MAG: NADH-quinone oxidoreductase subunit C [Gemmataceae bacterium]
MANQEEIARLRTRFEETVGRLKQRFSEATLTTSEFRDNFRVHVGADHLLAVLGFLKTECGFEMLVELGGADYLHYPEATDRYGVWYCLLNISTGQRIIVKSFANDPDPHLPSVFPLWKGSDWMEREVYDMYGVIFDGHPDLRRVLLPDEYTSFPMRKDYPLRGKGERHNFQPIVRADS